VVAAAASDEAAVETAMAAVSIRQGAAVHVSTESQLIAIALCSSVDPLSRDGGDEEVSGGPARHNRRQDRNDTRRNDPYGRSDRRQGGGGGGNADGSWSRDRHEQAPRQTVEKIIGDTVRLSNLAAGTSEDDLRYIFEKIGTITRAQVNFTAHGQCNGTAEVQFSTNLAADEAVKQLDQAEIDGRIMYVNLVGHRVQASLPVVARRHDGARDDRPFRDDDRQNGGGRRGGRDGENGAPRRERQERPAGERQERPVGEKRGGGAAGGRGGRGGKGGRPEKKEVSQADLDAELDNWHSNKGASAGGDAQPAAAAASSEAAPME
jgi:hypothetical protein